MLPSEDVRQDLGRMAELVQQGFHCSEILLLMGIEAKGKVNPELIMAVSSLSGGIGFTGDVCGALTGGACLLGLYAGRGIAGQPEDPKLRIMVNELVEWFSEEQQQLCGGIHCREIVGENPENIMSRCPRIVGRVYRKVRSLLMENGFDWKTAQTQPPAIEAPPTRRERACPVASRM
jgi:hypothetical protein